MKRFVLAVALLFVPLSARADSLDIQPGDHISIVGGTLAERMQHTGYTEARLVSRFGNEDLVIRNLAFSADELTIRLRSANFGSPDDWLKINKTDVVLAFFGSSESFAGEAGLPKFKADLDAYLKHLSSQKYNGESAPRIALFSPIAYEQLDDPNLPEGKEINRRLKLYTEAMAEVAKNHPVKFVDLFTPTSEIYASDARPLTFNGIHLTEYGDERLAPIIEDSLFPDGPKLKRDAAHLEKLRLAINDKNFHWFHKYRTTDGFSIYGGRADEPKNGLANRPVMAREMAILDVQTANRDQHIWALAKGQDHKIDDSNTPPYIPVKTNAPGPNPDGSYPYLGGVEAIDKMTVGKGLKINLFASEEKFPELINPVQMAIDTKGRVWVAAWPTYPHWTPKQPMNDKLLILEDKDGDGVADECKTFAGDLHNPTGFEFWNGGVLVAMAPDLIFLKDTDGDDKYDIKERVIHGLDTADTHHTANSFTFDPGGALYFQEGTFHHTQVETPWGTRRVANGAVFRYEPRAQKFDIYVSHGFANPHGHVFDRWGQDIVIDGTGAVPYHGTLFSGHIEFPNKHNGPPTVYPQRTRPCSGLEILTSRHFPDDFQGNLLVPNVIGFQGVLRYKLLDKDSSLGAQELEPIVSSSDRNFRPTDLEVGARGELFIADWQNPIIGHLQHNMRDPSRDKTHGRVYRVVHEGRELLSPPKIAGEPVEKLLDLLLEHEDRTRYRAKLELSARPSKEVVAAVEKWIPSLKKLQGEAYEHAMLEALWVYQHHNVVNPKLLEVALSSPDFRARAAAVRVVVAWRDRLPNALELVVKAAGDEHPRVRLEAVRAASFFTEPEAIEAVLVAEEKPTDVYLDYLTKETRRTLDPIWKLAVAEKRPVKVTTDAGTKFFLRNMSLEEVLKLERNRSVYLELLLRPGLRDELRREAIVGLAKLEKKSELEVLLAAIRRIDAGESSDEGTTFDLMRLLAAGNVAAARGEVEKLATEAKRPAVRQFAYAAIVSADGSADKAWSLAVKNASSLRDFVSAVPLISDGTQRAELYPKLLPLLDGLPESLGAARNAKGTYGRYVRIELPGRGTLTLAEVEVMSEGKNIARQGKATQKNVAHGGPASRAIDGNKSSSYGDGGQTHTDENTPNPWWEVDLGEEQPIDSIAVYNRGDGNLGNRLNNFTLKVLDSSRGEVFKQEKIAAPNPSSQFELSGGGPAALVRRAAMNALVSIRGQEAETFTRLATFIKEDNDRLAAIRALQRIPQRDWPKDQAEPLLEALLAGAKKIPAAERTSPAALDMLQLAEALTALLPAEQAKSYRGQLREIGVRVVRVGTLPERMAYDQEVLVIQAGKPVEFIFENTDLMPHNFVIAQPGALREVGEAAEATAQDPQSPARQYVPPSDKILLASKLLPPRETQKLSFQAPTAPGVYPYVCTFPGHWQRMHGALYVVADLDGYLENPEAYLAAAKLVAQDELLKERRPRTEWKLEDLATAVDHMEGRSYAGGKQMFQVATCTACHKMENVGREFGPDLAKLEAKFTAAEIWKHIVEPSATINEKFQTYVFEMSSGKVVTGIVLEETPDALKVIENPLLKADPIVLKKSEIAEQVKSTTSMMPKGLVDKLTRDEVLDLVAYLTARGKKDHALFHAGHGHEH